MNGLTIGELAKQSNVNLETIRFYEREALLPKPPRLRSGYRSFPAESVQQVRFIKRAQELGFSLREIKELLALRNEPRSASADVKGRVEQKISEIDRKMKALREMKKELVLLASTCSGATTIESCPIMESLGSDQE